MFSPIDIAKQFPKEVVPTDTLTAEHQTATWSTPSTHSGSYPNPLTLGCGFNLHFPDAE